MLMLLFEVAIKHCFLKKIEETYINHHHHVYRFYIYLYIDIDR